MVALAPLKSQLCNYLSYFPNFQVIYHSKSSPVLSTHDENKTTSAVHGNEINAKLAKFGIYPVTNLTSVFNETEEIVTAFKDILNQSNANDSTDHSHGN